LAQKKTFEWEAPVNRKRRRLADGPRHRYEGLRCAFLEAGASEHHELWGRFALFGFWGLLYRDAQQGYVVEVCQARPPRWCGRSDPQESVLREVFGLLTANGRETAWTAWKE